MKKILTTIAFVVGTFAGLTAQTNLSLISHLPQYAHGVTGDLIANDVTAFVAPNGTEYAIVGYYKGTSVVSLANPAAPVEVAWLPAQNGTGNVWRDVEVWGNYCYVTQENEGTGMHIINLSNTNNITATWWKPNLAGLGTMSSGHTLYVADGFMYVNGTNLAGGSTLIFDLATPMSPTYVGKTDGRYVHDSYVRGNRLYTANVNDGELKIYDITNKANPVLLATQGTPVAFAHNCWLSDDSNHIFVTEERSNAPITAYNISDVNNITEVSRFTGSLGQDAVFHNIYMVAGDFGVVANYTDGVRILDCSRPHNIVEVGNYDTYPGAITTTEFEGVWACYPYLPSGRLLAADISEGLFVFQPTYQRACWLEGEVTDAVTGNVINGAAVTISAAGMSRTTDIGGDYATGTVTAGSYSVTYSKFGYISQTVNVSLVNGQVVVENIALQPANTFSYTGKVVEAGTNTPLANAPLELKTTGATFNSFTNAAGDFTVSGLLTGSYDVMVGHWGHETRFLSAQQLSSNTGMVTIPLAKGYQDPFAIDLGWVVENDAACTDGFWVRGLPDNVSFQGFQLTPDTDDPTDLGELCYLTDNTGGQIGSADVDGGLTKFTSPAMDLSTMTDPYIKFKLWFWSLTVQNALGNDGFTVKMSNGTTTATVLSVPAQFPNGWEEKNIRVKDFLPLSNDMRIWFEAADTGVQNRVEAAVDNFLVYENVGTEALSLSAKMVCQPNPFGDACRVAYQLNTGEKANLQVTNIMGQVVETISVSGQDGFVSVGKNLPRGVYFVRLEQNGKATIAQKVVKQ